MQIIKTHQSKINHKKGGYACYKTLNQNGADIK